MVWNNYRREQIALTQLRPRPGQPPRPVPERIGEPSVFKHVVYIIKENRTYDQVLGDMKEGNGDPALCVFGERITPNQHKLAREFVLLDNTYCAGILSADGHQWSTTAFATDYMEKSFAGFPRSYPDGMGEDENDALAYSPAGFIWDNVIGHRKTLWNFGEFAMPAWAPGSYNINDYAKMVEQFSAAGPDGKPLEWRKTDKQTWRVELGRAREVTVRYKLYGNTLSNHWVQYNDKHAFISGPAAWMYLQVIRERLTLLYIQKGYINSGAIIPEQDVVGGVEAWKAAGLPIVPAPS